MTIAPASVQQSIQVQLVDDTGLELTGKLAAFFPTVSYQKAGANAAVPITLSDLATLATAWTSGGVKEIGSGSYRLDLPDAAVSTATRLTIIGGSSGKHVIAPPIDVAYTQVSVHDLQAAAQTDVWLAQSQNGAITSVNGNTFGFSLNSGVDPNQVTFDNHGVYIRAVTGLESRMLYALISAGHLYPTVAANYGIGDEIELIPSINLATITTSTGSGDTDVDHNTGGADVLRYTVGSGAGILGIDGATIRAYTLADYTAGNRTVAYVEGEATTGIVGGVSGRWLTPIRLTSNSGSNSFILEFTGAGYQTVTNALSL